MRFSEIKIIKEGYKEVKQKFISSNPEISEQDIHSYIEKFRDLVNRNQLQGNEKNIDYWGKQGFESFKEMVDFKSQQKSKTQAKRSKVKGDSLNLYEDDEWLIVIPLDKDASCFHGKNTDWCTAKPNRRHFEEYFYDYKTTLIYFIRKSDLEKWAIGVDTDDYIEYFDKNDNDISSSEFNGQTGLNGDKFVDMALKSKVPSQKRNEYNELLRKIDFEIYALKKGSDPNYEIENMLIKTKGRPYINKYIMKIGKSEKYSKEFQKIAVSVRPANLRFFINPDRDVLETALNKNGMSIRYIEKPDKELQFIAVEDDPWAVEYITNPYREVIVNAIIKNLNILNVLYNNKISSKLQMELVKKDKDIIKWIDNPHPDVVKYVKENS